MADIHTRAVSSAKCFSYLADAMTLSRNAELFAAPPDHDTLIGHGVSSTLVLQPEKFELCGCLGQQVWQRTCHFACPGLLWLRLQSQVQCSAALQPLLSLPRILTSIYAH